VSFLIFVALSHCFAIHCDEVLLEYHRLNVQKYFVHVDLNCFIGTLSILYSGNNSKRTAWALKVG
jgi:hypothetical protein